MKRIWWLARLVAMSLAIYCILGIANGSLQLSVRADDGGGGDPGGGCSQSCWYSQIQDKCFCDQSGCDSCIMPSGSGARCGACYKKPNLE